MKKGIKRNKPTHPQSNQDMDAYINTYMHNGCNKSLTGRILP
jgi:hypothetical protein